MELQVTRSKSFKPKMLGGSQTYYVLHLKATIPDSEAALLKKYEEEGGFKLAEAAVKLIAEKKIEGPQFLSLEVLKAGTDYKCKFLARALAQIPDDIVSDYRSRLARIRACENWEGEDRLSSDQPVKGSGSD